MIMQYINTFILALGIQQYFSIRFWASFLKVDLWYEKIIDKVIAQLDFATLAQRLSSKILESATSHVGSDVQDFLHKTKDKLKL